ncbi:MULTISPECIES: protein translocase subunit SecF [Streptomycetaceae]|uniref:Protein-export membrane protein SecF n=1 Tax=Streptantibioticus cattleyicolor (strain ATCC 35852 / DSM 46488 / JCM 4925 / NBRC 14057 / NRRL 8057) TaxID=1003195 RepID=F8K4V7_STREN|nr:MULTISPECIES: protein translocase subunit SecF [Streptomycetaceae]AEW97676.1 preprotein translocase subunit SecF [Streptantibioticus cattleyicolor NRRL 8057 = DSM 46488]MYS62102.1 protein translocase subunit SecF [Streptomyces sp. SID5468]CCB77996.1 Protein-export membrane protein secF [Streptantibioticus cattleyicolor NRRL 8057 = DSM 46488]
MSRLGTLGHRLHRGEVSYDFVGKRKIWYGVSILITLVAIVGLAVNGLNRGIEFSGGAVFTTPKTSMSTAAAQSKASDAAGGRHDVIVQKLGTGGLRIQISGINGGTADNVKDKLAAGLGVKSVDAQVVGPSWGKEISQKALLGLVIFMVLVVVYLAIAFEWRMALSALVALVHDLTITVGVYALVGFEVTPGTVIGLLTILGYSLYDTVVVFDGLKETTKGITGQTRFTYSELANRSLNQTLVRSINTTVVALLPVAALLFVGGGLLGAGMLNDIALALFVGLAAGAYSSIFIATPLVASFKERTPEMRGLARRVAAKRAKGGADEGDESGTGTVGPDENAPEDGADDDEPVEAGSGAGTGIGSQRRTSAPRSNRGGRGRPSGKRR